MAKLTWLDGPSAGDPPLQHCVHFRARVDYGFSKVGAAGKDKVEHVKLLDNLKRGIRNSGAVPLKPSSSPSAVQEMKVACLSPGDLDLALS